MKTTKKLMLFLLLALPRLSRADGQWVLEQSTLTYHVSHPLHETEGISHEARGKAVCQAGQCDVLIAVPVKSFDSGDSNRDLHMLQAAHGAQFPIVSVRIHLPESATGASMIHCDLEIDFAGQTARYKQVPFEQTTQGPHTRISGVIPATLSDFKIPPPSLLTVPVKNEMPVRVETTWRHETKANTGTDRSGSLRGHGRNGFHVQTGRRLPQVGQREGQRSFPSIFFFQEHRGQRSVVVISMSFSPSGEMTKQPRDRVLILDSKGRSGAGSVSRTASLESGELRETSLSRS